PPRESATDSSAQAISADGQHVGTSERLSDESVWDKYVFTVYNRQTQARVGQFRTYSASVSFMVVEPIVVFTTDRYSRRTDGRLVEEPAKVRGVDLRSGKELWNQT